MELGVEEASRLMSSRSTEEGWCLVACRGEWAPARQQAAGRLREVLTQRHPADTCAAPTGLPGAPCSAPGDMPCPTDVPWCWAAKVCKPLPAPWAAAAWCWCGAQTSRRCCSSRPRP